MDSKHNAHVTVGDHTGSSAVTPASANVTDPEAEPEMHQTFYTALLHGAHLSPVRTSKTFA